MFEQDLKKDLALSIIIVLLFLKNAIIYSIITSFPQLEDEFSLNYTQLGILTSLYFTFAFIGSIFWVIILIRKSRAFVFLFGSVFWIFGILALINSTKYLGILISVSIIGWGSESISLVLMNELMDHSNSKNKSILVSIFFLFSGIGNLFGMILTSILKDQFDLSWKMPLLIIFLASLLMFILLFLSWKNKFKVAYIENIEGLSHLDTFIKPIDPKITKKDLKIIFSNKINISIFLISLLFLPINGFNNIWLQKYYIEIRGLNQLMATISVVFTSGAEFLGLVLGSKITDKFSEKTPGKRLFIGFIAALIAAPLFLIPFLLIWTLTAHPTIGMNFIEICWYMFISAMKNYQIFLSYILLFFGFFFLAFIGPIIIPALSDFNQSEHKNLAINFCLVIYYFSWVISPILGGIIGDRFSLKHIFLLAPFIYAIVSLLFLVAYRITLRNGLL